jgi:hypothetical protein
MGIGVVLHRSTDVHRRQADLQSDEGMGICVPNPAQRAADGVPAIS